MVETNHRSSAAGCVRGSWASPANGQCAGGIWHGAALLRAMGAPQPIDSALLGPSLQLLSLADGRSGFLVRADRALMFGRGRKSALPRGRTLIEALNEIPTLEGKQD